MALDSGQPIGDLCELAGLPRTDSAVFDAMYDLLYQQSDDAAQAARIADLKRRMGGAA